jgi:hypothetical protein
MAHGVGKTFLTNKAKLKYHSRLVKEGLLEADDVTGRVAWDVATKLPRWTARAPALALKETSFTLNAAKTRFPRAQQSAGFGQAGLTRAAQPGAQIALGLVPAADEDAVAMLTRPRATLPGMKANTKLPALKAVTPTPIREIAF